MTGRTLEEIEALAADATPGPWAMNTDPPYDSVVGSDGRTVCCDTAYYPTAVSIEDMRLIAALPDLLAIAQGQREALQEAKAAMRDMLCGWKIIRNEGGEEKVYGIGWDRAQSKVEAALDKIP